MDVLDQQRAGVECQDVYGTKSVGTRQDHMEKCHEISQHQLLREKFACTCQEQQFQLLWFWFCWFHSLAHITVM